jgi:hypothetical protein
VKPDPIIDPQPHDLGTEGRLGVAATVQVEDDREVVPSSAKLRPGTRAGSNRRSDGRLTTTWTLAGRTPSATSRAAIASLTVITAAAIPIDNRSWTRRIRWNNGSEARGNRLRKNSGIASWRSSRRGTPASRSGSAANARKSGRLWTWTTP